MQEQQSDESLIPAAPPLPQGTAIHARVLPSLFVEALHRPFKTWMGSISPFELVCWTRGGEPPSSIGDDIRGDTMRRLRQRKQHLWEMPTRVPLTDGWEARLERLDVLAVHRVQAAHPDRLFQELTLNDIKPALQRPWEAVLALLARLEGHHWVVPEAPPHRRNGWKGRRQSDASSEVDLTPDIRTAVERALALSWIGGVAANDLRFGIAGKVSLEPWLRAQLQRKTVSPHLAEVAESLWVADSLTYADEVTALATAAVQRCHPSPSPGNEVRWIQMFSARFVAPDAPRTLQSIGEVTGLTRERVRQICDSMLQVLLSQPCAKPAIERVLRMATRSAPLSPVEMSVQLSRHLGDGSGIESVFEFAEALGLKEVPVRLGNVKVRRGKKYEDASIVETAEATNWPQACLRYAHAECAAVGCTNLVRIAGLIALREGAAPGAESIVSVLASAPDFRWLGEEGGWFSIGDTNNSGAAFRLRKILAIAHLPVSVDSVSEAFACDTRWFRDYETRALAIPPTHVTQAMVSAWPWVKSVQYTKFIPTEPISAEILTGLERLAVSIIEESDGVAVAWQLYERLTTELGVTKMAVSVTLASSPILVRFEHGLYTLRGRRFVASALTTAREILFRRNTGQGRTLDSGTSFRVKVSQASLVNEQYTVPAHLKEQMAGKKFAIESSPATLSVSRLGVMRGINRHFGDLSAGDVLVVEFNGDSVRIARDDKLDA